MNHLYFNVFADFEHKNSVRVHPVNPIPPFWGEPFYRVESQRSNEKFCWGKSSKREGKELLQMELYCNNM